MLDKLENFFSLIEFAEAEYLKLLYLVLALFFIFLFLKRERYIVTFLRFFTLSLLVLSLSQPQFIERKESAEMSVLFDVSNSLSSSTKEELADKLLALNKDSGFNSKISIYPFSADALVEPLVLSSEESAKSLVRKVTNLASELDISRSNFERSFSSLSFLDSALLISDGLETSGSVENIFSSIRPSLYPLISDSDIYHKEQLEIRSFYLPLVINAGEKAKISLSLANSFDKEISAQVKIFLEDKEISNERINIEGNREKLFTVETSALETGLKRVRALIVPDSLEELSAHRWISVKERSRVLLISGSRKDESIISKLLKLSGISVDSRVLDGNNILPEQIDNYSAIILNNARKTQVGNTFLLKLKTYVEKGGGLLMIGGSRSFGLGGYKKTILEDISPVKFVPPTTAAKRLNAAVVLLIDKSRSMLRQNKMLSAKRAALVAINALKDDDYVSVIGFDRTPFTVIKLRPVKEVRAIAQRRLDNLIANGGTELLPALFQAKATLKRSTTSRKHIILLSDGKFSHSSPRYVSEVRQMKSNGITLSSIALGAEADIPLMKTLAKSGDGVFYKTLDPRKLPEIFLKDIKVSTGERTIKEQEDFLVEIGPEGLVSTNIREYPKLRGFVETLPKRGSNLELLTFKDDKPYPILSSWTYKLGKVIAFTSDANSRWSSRWTKWDNFSVFWKQLLDFVQSGQKNEQRDIDFVLRHKIVGERLLLDLAIFDEKLAYAPSPNIVAKIVEPQGEIKQISFEEAAKGRYQLELDKARSGDYMIDIAYESTKFPPLALTLPADAFGERPGKGINLELLRELAKRSGGQINPEKFSTNKKISEKKIELFPYLLYLSIGLILLEAFIRELGWMRGKGSPQPKVYT